MPTRLEPHKMPMVAAAPLQEAMVTAPRARPTARRLAAMVRLHRMERRHHRAHQPTAPAPLLMAPPAMVRLRLVTEHRAAMADLPPADTAPTRATAHRAHPARRAAVILHMAVDMVLPVVAPNRTLAMVANQQPAGTREAVRARTHRLQTILRSKNTLKNTDILFWAVWRVVF